MARTLYGHLDDVLANDEATFLDTESTTLVNESDVSRKDTIVLFVPGVDVTVLRKALPAQSDAEARQAAPFAVEDDLGQSVDEVHIALGNRPASLAEPRAIHIASEAVMADWLEALKTRDLERAQLLAEQSVVPEGRALDVGHRILLNAGGQAAALDKGLPQEILRTVLADSGLSAELVDDPLQVLAELASARDDLVDLRQGAFKARYRGEYGGLAERWRLSGLLAAAIGLVWLGANLLETRSVNLAADELERDMRTMVADVFPGRANSANPASLVSRALSERNQTAELDFLQTSAALYVALDEVPGSRLLSMRFDPRGNGLVAQVAYVNYGDDATLKSVLAELGVSAEIGSARQGNGHVLGDVTLEARS